MVIEERDEEDEVLKSSCPGTQKIHNRVIILDYILGSCAVIVY